jgi:thiamine biosynthesis lipoprotein
MTPTTPCLLLFAVLLEVTTARGASPEPARFEFADVQMGMQVRLVLYASHEDEARGAADATFQLIEDLNAAFSDYDPASELSRLSADSGRGKVAAVSEPLWEVLTAAQALSRRSDGAFDVTVGPLTRLWRRARRDGELPSRSRLDEALRAVGYEKIKLTEEGSRVELTTSGMRLDLGGIAVGYACDRALALLAERGFNRAMIDFSGDILTGDPPPGQEGWRIGIAPLDKPDGPPSRFVVLSRAAVTTSGAGFQSVEIGGVRYSHIVDPHTGLGMTDPLSVTVIARDCMTADSLATAASVLGSEKGLRLVSNTAGASALFLRQAPDGQVQAITSPEWHPYERPRLQEP